MFYNSKRTSERAILNELLSHILETPVLKYELLSTVTMMGREPRVHHCSQNSVNTVTLLIKFLSLGKLTF